MYSEIIVDEHFEGLNPMQLGHEACIPSHSYGPAVRTHWLLHYVVSGFGTFTRENITYNIKPGEIFVIPPYIETYYQADEKSPWKYIWIGFTTKNIPEVLDRAVISCPNIGTIFHEMLLCSKLENGRSAHLASCLWKLVSILSENGEAKSNHIDKAINYMHSNYANEISIQQIAETLGLNRKYFCSLFTAQIGVSPSEYLISLRLNKAAELMTKHNQSPTTAAISVGYNDIYHFSKSFKKHFGISPRTYCKNQL